MRSAMIYLFWQWGTMNTPRLPKMVVDTMLGKSRKMAELLFQIHRVAATDVPVLLVGEKGTGKSLAAHVIHELSPRQGGPFTKINSGFTANEGVIGELLIGKGHKKFSHPGSLFLDKIDALSLPLQEALAHYLDDQLTIVGDDGSHAPAETRLIAATNQDITRAIGEGKFLEDLYLSFVILTVPALRERGNDILLLADALLGTFASRYGRRLTGFSVDARATIRSFDWPGNIRELRHRILRGVLMAKGLELTHGDLGLKASKPAEPAASLLEAREALEK